MEELDPSEIRVEVLPTKEAKSFLVKVDHIPTGKTYTSLSDNYNDALDSAKTFLLRSINLEKRETVFDITGNVQPKVKFGSITTKGELITEGSVSLGDPCPTDTLEMPCTLEHTQRISKYGKTKTFLIEAIESATGYYIEEDEISQLLMNISRKDLTIRPRLTDDQIKYLIQRVNIEYGFEIDIGYDMAARTDYIDVGYKGSVIRQFVEASDWYLNIRQFRKMFIDSVREELGWCKDNTQHLKLSDHLKE